MKKKWKLALLAVIVSSSFWLPTAVGHAATAAEVTKEASALKKTNPQEAIAKLQQYIADNPAENPTQLALMEIAISQIYIDQLKQLDNALAVIDKGMARSSSSGSYFRLANYKCYRLFLARRFKEADTFFHAELPKYLAQPPKVIMSPLVKLLQYYYSYIVPNTGTSAEIIATFRAVMEKHPYFISYQLMTSKAIEALMKEPGKEKEALAWAKLYWMTCDFNENSVKGATALLQKAWIAAEMNTANSTAFLKALQDPQAPNPLKDVSLAPLNLDAAKIKEVQKNMPATMPSYRINLHLMQGEYGEAMLIGRRLLLDNPMEKANSSALQMARVFKAADLNMVGANALLQYMQTGEGTNPVDEFFKQYPASNTGNG